VLVDPALQQPGGLRPVDQLHRAVVAQQQVPGDLADGGPARVGVAADRQQQLVLRGREAGGGGLLGAPAQEPAQPGPKAQQAFVLGLVEGWHLATVPYREARAPPVRARRSRRPCHPRATGSGHERHAVVA
jgi:hypothetical protein